MIRDCTSPANIHIAHLRIFFRLVLLGLLGFTQWVQAALISVNPTALSISAASGGSYSIVVTGAPGESVDPSSFFCVSLGVTVPANGLFPVTGGCTVSSVPPNNSPGISGGTYSFFGSLTPAQSSTLLSEAIAAGQPAGARHVYWVRGFGASGYAAVRFNLLETTSTPPTLLPSTINFGNVIVGQVSPNQVLTFSSNSTANGAPLNISHPSWTNASTTCPTTLTANLVCTVTVACAPTAAGALSGPVTVSAGTLSATSTLSCTGSSAPPPGTLTLTPTTVAFGAVTTGTTAVRSLVLANGSAQVFGNLNITAAAPFTVNHTCGTSLAIGASCQINVVFAPTAVQAYLGTLNVVGSTQTLTAQLSGSGSSAPIINPASGLTGLSPQRAGVSASADTSLSVLYQFAGNATSVTPVDGVFCLDVQAPLQQGGTSATSPCIGGSEFARHPTRPAQFQTSVVGGTVRSVRETLLIPALVARHVQLNGKARFYFVRQFQTAQYAVLVLDLTGDSAARPLTLTDVSLAFVGTNDPIAFVPRGDEVPALEARLRYSGSGWLRGAWEVVQPGDSEPNERDLLTEASLPLEQRGLQRRYQVVGSFQHWLPAQGEFRLPGPDRARLPASTVGGYRVVLRIFAEPGIGAQGDAGYTAGAAGFALPTLRYFVGSFAGSRPSMLPPLPLLQPQAGQRFTVTQDIRFAWMTEPRALLYVLEAADSEGRIVAAAQLLAAAAATRAQYEAPRPWREKAARLATRWRVTALGADGQLLSQSEWRPLDIQ